NELSRVLAKPLLPGLHIVATPIGNLGDMTLRALATLQLADVIYCEDTRHSRTLISHFGLDAKLRPYHEHNADQERPRILARLAAGERVALISDAGTPLISDPGFKLVREAIAEGHGVIAVPGACAAIAALTIAGLPTDCFLFAGFLPPKSGQRQTRLKALRDVSATLVFYEAPTRVAEALADMLIVLGDRSCAIARELTKLHETVARGTIAGLIASIGGEAMRGEIAIVVGPPVAGEISDDDIVAALRLALRSQTTRDAVRSVAENLAAPRSRVYNLATLIEHDEQT
ncbi:MAG: 16S rRNA (cytidine(1402)-2'-O)-methyltransferase, partial [Hyphomicrobiaceae bacterium]